MWEGSRTDLLSGKSMFIDMHDIDSLINQHSALLCTGINKHVVDDVLKHKLSMTLGRPGVGPRKELLCHLHFLIHKMGRQHYLFTKGLLVDFTCLPDPATIRDLRLLEACFY